MSDAQLVANRANAQLSTGPQTDEGKANSRMNALRHGFYSAQPVLPGENQEEFDALAREMFDELEPADLIQQSIVERMVAVRWKQLRMRSIQVEYVEARIEKQRDSLVNGKKPTTAAAVIAWEYVRGQEGMKQLIDLEIKLDRLFLSLMRELQKLKKHATQFASAGNARNEANSERPADATSENGRNEPNPGESQAPSNTSRGGNEANSAPNDAVIDQKTVPIAAVGVPVPRDQRVKTAQVFPVPGRAVKPNLPPRR